MAWYLIFNVHFYIWNFNGALETLYNFQAVISVTSISKDVTRQVYNGPLTSTLSQQQQQNCWSKMIFEQKNQKNFPKKKILNKIWETKFGK